MENKEIEKRYSELVYNYPYLKNIINESEDEKVHIDMDLNNKRIYSIEKNEHSYFMSSRYDCEIVTAFLINKLNAQTNPFAPILVFGVGDLFFIKTIRDKFPDNYVYIHEPSVSMFRAVVESMEDISILIDDHVLITVGANMDGARTEILHDLIDEKNYFIADIVCMPQYDHLMAQAYSEFLRAIHTRVEQIVMQKNTDIVLNDEHINTFWNNITDIINQYGVGTLTNELKNNDSENYAAFIVSAGPSLDKNVDELKKIQGRAMIMAVDTALKPLLKKGIVPDIIASVDPHKPLSLFESDGFAELPMLVDINYNSEISKMHTGKRFYAWSGESFIKELFKNEFSRLDIIESGGSVACNLLSLAIRSGFKTIVLVGQDLSYPEGKGHSKLSYDNENNIDLKKKKYYEVEDIYGGKIYTENNMNAYRKWFEGTISRYTDIEFIDATEGGAKINGTDIMTLNEAITKCCNGKKTERWREIVNGCAKLLSEDEKEEKIAKLKAIPNKLDRLQKELKTGEKKIKRARKAQAKNDIINLKKELNGIIKINHKIDEGLEIALLNMYNAKESYEVATAIYDLDKNQENEIDNTLKICELTNKQYQKALKQARKDLANKFNML